jgi:hypothetical protein
MAQPISRTFTQEKNAFKGGTEMNSDKINEENYELYLVNVAAIGVRLGKSSEEMAAEIKNVADHFWRIKREQN